MVCDAAVLGAFLIARDRQNDHTDDIAAKQRREFVCRCAIGNQFHAAGYLSGRVFLPGRLQTQIESRSTPNLVCFSGTSLETSSFRRSPP
jgi:hypothetical protein